MRLFKLITGGLIVLIVGLFFWQNTPTFTTQLPFQFNLYIKEQLQWSLNLYTLLLMAGAAGLVLGLLLMLRPYFNVRRLLAQERQERQQVLPAAEQAAPPEDENLEQGS